jgi:hypothetical protein
MKAKKEELIKAATFLRTIAVTYGDMCTDEINLLEQALNEVQEVPDLFGSLKVGDRVKTKLSGMGTVKAVKCINGKMVMIECDTPKWICTYFYEEELDLDVVN